MGRLKTLFLFFLLLPYAVADPKKGWRQHVENFFCAVDQDGDGEIAQHEATKFLSSFGSILDSTEELKLDSSEGKDAVQESTILNFKGDFSYGGTTISAEEMLDHLQNMLTADHVVDWITHGLQLPQYAQAFRENAVNGLDFPALIEDHSRTLLDELRVQSRLHRKKITHAIVRQMFGFGAVPAPIENLTCVCSSCGAINLHWDPPLFVGYPPLHKYLVHKHADNTAWISIGDSKERSFIDNSVQHGKLYSYRVQAWGNHGPSAWSFVYGCQVCDVCGPNDSCTGCSQNKVKSLDINSHPNEIEKGDKKMKSDAKAKDELSDWGWIYTINGFCLLFGIISRQSFFIRIILASWTLFRFKIIIPLLTRVIEAQKSRYVFCRIASKAFLTMLYLFLYIQAKIWDLSGNISCTVPNDSLVDQTLATERKLVEEIEEFQARDVFSDKFPCTQNAMSSAVYNDLMLSKMLSEAKAHNRTSHKNPNPHIGNSHQFHFVTEAQHSDIMPLKVQDLEIAQEVQSSKRKQKNPWTTIDEVKQSYSSESRAKSVKNSVYDYYTVDMEKAFNKKTHSKMPGRKRCNFRGCKVRFDRWYFLSDWQMNFMKHYCGYCQKVYCVKHTRISLHGTFGHCGLESDCVCEPCFSELSPEVQEKLELRNRLHVGSYFSHEATSISKRNKASISRLVSLSTKEKKGFVYDKNSVHAAESFDHQTFLTADDPSYLSDSSDISSSNTSHSSAASSCCNSRT